MVVIRWNTKPKIEHSLALDVGDHGSVLPNDIEFVDAQDTGRPEPNLGFELLDEVIEDVADRLFISATSRARAAMQIPHHPLTLYFNTACASTMLTPGICPSH